MTQADVRAGAALAAYENYDYAAAEREARFAYDGLAAAAAQINVHLAPAAYQAVRRNPADFNQAMRDWIRFITGTGDSVAAMTGTAQARPSRAPASYEAGGFEPSWVVRMDRRGLVFDPGTTQPGFTIPLPRRQPTRRGYRI